MTHRSFLTVSATMLAVAAIAAPVWASDEDDEDDGNDSPPVTQEAPAPTPSPFVQAPAPVDVPQTAPPAPAPVVLETPETPSAPSQPAKHTHRVKHRKVASHHVKARPRAVRTRPARATRPTAMTVATRTMPRGGVQAGEGGMATVVRP